MENDKDRLGFIKGVLIGSLISAMIWAFGIWLCLRIIKG